MAMMNKMMCCVQRSTHSVAIVGRRGKHEQFVNDALAEQPGVEDRVEETPAGGGKAPVTGRGDDILYQTHASRFEFSLDLRGNILSADASIGIFSVGDDP